MKQKRGVVVRRGRKAGSPDREVLPQWGLCSEVAPRSLQKNSLHVTFKKAIFINTYT